jgi:L-asparaginase / beta-aspartyl-peptidase
MPYDHLKTPESTKKGPDMSGRNRWALAMHGGAGEISDKTSIPARMEAFTAIEEEGRKMLSGGASALDTVQHVVSLLEDCKYFNAGRGSVFTHTGTHEMDACIMDGTAMTTGACANVGNVRNPIKLARVIAENTQHCLLAGVGAEALGAQHGIEREDNIFFYQEERYQQLLAARKTGEVVLDHGGALRPEPGSRASMRPEEVGVVDRSNQRTKREAKLATADAASAAMHAAAEAEELGFVSEEKFSTVGCVARDIYGNLAAAGSTGGLCNKQPGRVGDTPIVCAGVYANSKTCAIACTGHGETFLKNAVAYDIHARMKYAGKGMSQAMNEAIMKSLPAHTGGCVGVSADGDAYASYNTSGMFTGISDHTGRVEVYHKEDLSSEAAVHFEIVPQVVDPFTSTGVLKVLYERGTGGAKTTLRIAVGPAVPLDPAMLGSQPTAFWAPRKDGLTKLHTLIMVTTPPPPPNMSRTSSFSSITSFTHGSDTGGESDAEQSEGEDEPEPVEVRCATTNPKKKLHCAIMLQRQMQQHGRTLNFAMPSLAWGQAGLDAS